MKNVVIYYPNGTTSYFEVGKKLLNANKQETEIEIINISEEDNKIIVLLSNNEKYLYSLPYSIKLN